MQTQRPNWVQYVILVVGLLLLIGLFTGYFNKDDPVPPTAEEIAALVPAPNVPTAAEIAALVEVPKLKGNSNDLDDILEGVYPDEVEDLVNDCANDLWDEFGDDVESDIEDELELDLGEEVKDVTIEDYNWDDEFEYDIIDLGLHDEDDRAIDFFSVLRVRYHEEFGDDDWHYAKVEASASCSDWDDNDNEFDDLSVDYIVV